MTTNMLFFDYQEHEKSFFEKNNIEGLDENIIEQMRKRNYIFDTQED